MIISLEEYLKEPCAKLSIPYWKAKTIKVPENIKILHDSEFFLSCSEKYEDERYFRLYRNFNNINSTELKGFYITTASESDIPTIVSVINNSYTDLQVSTSQVEGYTKTPAYKRDLWILVKEENTDVCVGCAIADYDSEAGELILEWVQVLPVYRNRKIGQALVNELLNRAKGFASFATVSGKADNPTNPALYRKCGFTGNDVWHVMRRCGK